MLGSAMSSADEGLRPVYLRSRRVHLRAMVEGDKEHGAAWFDGTFVVNASQAEKVLKDEHGGPWWSRSQRRLAIVTTGDDAIAGSVRISSHNGYRTCDLAFEMAPWRDDADALRADALSLLVHWLRDETELMVVTVGVAADEPETIASAEALGMVPAARLREWFGRPQGRVDRLVYQALNPRWEVRDA